MKETGRLGRERGCLRRNTRKKKKKSKDLGTVLEEETHSLSQAVCQVGTQMPTVALNHPCFPLRWKENPGN